MFIISSFHAFDLPKRISIINNIMEGEVHVCNTFELLQVHLDLVFVLLRVRPFMFAFEFLKHRFFVLTFCSD